MEQIRIEEENMKFFNRKNSLSDFECWALKKFAFVFGYCNEGQWWWNDGRLYVGDGTSLWLTDNGNIMFEVVDDDEDVLFIIRF